MPAKALSETDLATARDEFLGTLESCTQQMLARGQGLDGQAMIAQRELARLEVARVKYDEVRSTFAAQEARAAAESQSRVARTNVAIAIAVAVFVLVQAAMAVVQYVYPPSAR